jgi:hypothetical protein
MKWLYLLVLLTTFSQVALAADDTFKVRMLVGEDTTPPTTPDNLVALPVSTTQIDLTWDASTDNFIFGGYQVWRDALQIATTTLTSYSDTGLIASTTYSYYIVAFDEALNYSSSSTIVSTTTLQVVVTPPAATSSSGSIQSSKAPMEINDLTIETTETTANISFDSNAYTRVTWRWGRTINYELGYVGSEIYRQGHETTLTELEPGTIYELEILLTRRLSGETLIERVQFETKSQLDDQAPANVTNLRAELQNNGEIKLDWINPKIEDISYIRVLSNDYFYPLDRTDGWLVYDGLNETLIDKRPLTDSRYYTVFVFDKAGNRSSGAVTYVSLTEEGEEPVVETNMPFDLYGNFDFNDVQIFQAGEVLPHFNGTVTIERQSETLFKIPYGSLPENLKTIILTLTDPVDKSKTFSFILAINADRTAYEASIGELPILGYYETTISIYDYSANVVARKSGGVVVSDGYFEDRAVKVIEDIRLLINWPLVFISSSLLLILLVWLIWRFFVRR